MDTLIQLGSAVVIVSGLYLLHFRKLEQVRKLAEAQGYGQGYEAGLAESNQTKYAKGYEDGVYEGRLKERMDQETRERRALRTYEQGYEDALRDIAAADAQATTGATIRLSA